MLSVNDIRNSKHIRQHVLSTFTMPPDMSMGEFSLTSASLAHNVQAIEWFFDGDQNAVETTETE